MKITITPKDIVNLIKTSLNEKTPLLITRYGEGEMRMFRNNEDSDWIIKNMFGYVPPKNIMDEIRLNMELGLINSDITGLPSYKNAINEEEVLLSPIHELYKETYSRFREIFKKYNLVEDDFKYCDVNVNTQLHSQNLYPDLLTNLNELVIITCRDVSELIKNHFNIKNIKVYTIPPEYKYEDDPSKVTWNFYPEVHSKIKEDILKTDNKGKLCLYGAGLAGKDLGYYFKQSGGVAIDIGSVFDLWVGKKTRGENKGRGVYFKSVLK